MNDIIANRPATHREGDLDNPRSARVSLLPSSQMQSLSLSQDCEENYNDVMIATKPYQDTTQNSINNTKHHQEFFEVLNRENTMTLTMHEKADFQEISMLHKHLEEDYEKRF